MTPISVCVAYIYGIRTTVLIPMKES